MIKNLLNFFLRKIGLQIHGIGYLHKLSKTEFHKDAFAFQKQKAGNSSKIIFDVGANKGLVTKQYLELFDKAKIYAFEPIPEMIEIFNSLHEGNKNVKLFQKALSNELGTAIFNLNKSADTSSLLKSTKIGANSDAQCKTISTFKVETDTIDNFCRLEKIPYIDILKLDVQGAEFFILQGAKEMLKNKKIGIIYSEVYFKEQYVNQPLFFDISKLLISEGYMLQDIYNPYYNSSALLWADAIFIQNN